MVTNSIIARICAHVNSAAALIEALGGDPNNGMCCCPAHDDQTPSLHVGEGSNGKTLFYCHAGCSQADVIDALKARGLWPDSKAAYRSAITPRRSTDERRQFALRILHDTRANRGVELSEFLSDYFAGRRIKTVPATAMLALPFKIDLKEGFVPEEPAMVFAVVKGDETIGVHVTWLTPDLTAKCTAEPARQFFGPIGGGYIKIYAGELDPSAKLIIAEGVETAMAAAQIAGGLPAIAALSAANMPKITPPIAAEYIVAADNDSAGLAGARALASKLARAGHPVRLAMMSLAGRWMR